MKASIFDFGSADTFAAWHPVNDAVMGGVSDGSLEPGADEVAVFTGCVSFENNGGFASIRSIHVVRDLGGFDGVELVVRGDGRRYRLNLVDDSSAAGVLHAASFETHPDWQKIRIPFGAFRPRRRGRLLLEARALDRARVASFGLMIADGMDGPFKLEIREIRAYRAD